jgi:hypothetical protein
MAWCRDEPFGFDRSHAWRHTGGLRAADTDGYLRRGERELLLWAPEDEPSHSLVVREVARLLRLVALNREPRGMLIAAINGSPAATHSDARLFTAEGFAAGAMGLQVRP